MKPARFAMERPSDLAAALAMLAGANGTTKIIAGGQSLGPMLNLRLVEPDRLVDISGVPELRRIDRANGALGVGGFLLWHGIERQRRTRPVIVAVHNGDVHEADGLERAPHDIERAGASDLGRLTRRAIRRWFDRRP